MSDIDTPIAGSRKEQAKELIGQAGQTLKAEAQSFASAAQDRVTTEAKKGVDTAGKTLGDFANAIRKAGDELATADQSPASRLVAKAADGLEDFSRNLAGKDPGELLNAVRDFGRRNPAVFIGGAVLVGLALGRFARASESTGSHRLSDETLTFAEEDAFDGPAETGLSGGVAQSLSDNLGDLQPGEDGATSLGVDDGTSGIGEGSPGDGAGGTGR